MSRRIEIQPEPRGMARVETFVGSRLTGMSETLPLAAARSRAESMAGLRAVIVDHTATQFAPVTNRPVSFR
jgi:hypothetical protein